MLTNLKNKKEIPNKLPSLISIEVEVDLEVDIEVIEVDGIEGGVEVLVEVEVTMMGFATSVEIRSLMIKLDII